MVSCKKNRQLALERGTIDEALEDIQMISESHPIIVLGAERSGTSVVVEMVYRWGAYAGPSEKLQHG